MMVRNMGTHTFTFIIYIRNVIEILQFSGLLLTEQQHQQKKLLMKYKASC
jgi:hypothetical protein